MLEDAKALFCLVVFLCLCLPTTPLQISFHSCNNMTQVYPTTKSYNSDSCQCLQMMMICSNTFQIQFSGLTPNQSLYYEFDQPKNISVQGTFIFEKLDIEIDDIGVEKRLYFQYGGDELELHFSFVNKTKLDETGGESKVFDWSYVVGTCTGLLLIWIQTTYLKIYRFESARIRWWFAFPYMLFAGTMTLLLHFTKQAFQYFQYALVGALTIFCTYFFFEQIMATFGFKHKILKHLYWRDLIAGMMVVVFVVLRIFLGNTWYLNDIFMFMIVGGILKIFRVKSIRSSLFFMLAVIVVNVLVERLYRLTGERLGVSLVDNYPSPLQMQIPTISFVYNRRCAWVQITDIIFPGLLFSYCRRLDNSLKISVYSVFSGLSIALSATLQIIIYTYCDLQLPQDAFSVPITIGLLFLISSRRGEWSVVWYGGFYDGTGERVSLTKEVEWDSLTKDMEKSLLVN